MVGAGVAAAVAVVVSHVVDPFYFEGWRCGWKSGAASQPRARDSPAGLLFAAMPVLVVIRIALVRVVIAIGLGTVVHGGSFLFRGLGLDIPGEGVAVAYRRAVDERLRRQRRSCGLGR